MHFNIVTCLCLSCTAGIFLTFGFAPFVNIFAVLLGIYSFLHILRIGGITKMRQFLIGFAFAFGHFSSSLYWVVYALGAEPEKFSWIAPYALIFIPSFLSIFYGMMAMSFCFFAARSHMLAAVAFPGLWVVFEVLRGYLFFNFPWNLLGYSLHFSLYLMQGIKILGIFGLSFVIVFYVSALYSRCLVYIGLAHLILVSLLAYGYYELCNHDVSENELLDMRIIQPNLTLQDFTSLGSEQILEKLLALSNAPSHSNKQFAFVIWPESIFPHTISIEFNELYKLKNLIPHTDALIFGVDRVAYNQEGEALYYNSVVLLPPQEHKISFYDKRILVPFGEYIPLPAVLTAFSKIAKGLGSFSAGNQRPALYAKGVGTKGVAIAIPLICYEAIMRCNDLRPLSLGSLFLLNITNDSWFGSSIGPYQHFAMSRMRAIEYGLPLVRVANSGISAVMDNKGKIMEILGLNVAQFRDVRVFLSSDFQRNIGNVIKILIMFFIMLLCSLSLVIRFF